jgi:PPOX class probable F420-dependent enzyme
VFGPSPFLVDESTPIKGGQMAQLTEKARQRLSDPNFGYLATIMEDGSPQVSPVWVDVEGDQILFNTAKGRVKEQNLRRDPRVAISIADKDDQYDKVDIRGRVVDWIEGDEAFAHIDKMAKKYLGEDKYPGLKPGEERVIAKIEPERISERG